MNNIKDVAKYAGVSISTVSHVINKTKYVSPELVSKVENAINILGYEVNPIARSMKSNKSGIIGVITEDLCGIFYPYIIKGISSVLEKAGYQIMICDITGETDGKNALNREYELIKKLISNRVDGIIFASLVPTDKRKRYCSKLLKLSNESKKIPLISIERDLSEFGIASVYFDSYENAKIAVNHLIDCGCKKIAHIAGPMNLEVASQRTISYIDIMKEHNLDELIYYGDYSHRSGYAGMKQLIDNTPDIDGVFCANDQIAVGALKLLKQYGKRIPEDIKVMGYDDVFVSNIVEPPISTVHIRKHETGVRAAELLLKQLSNEYENPIKIKMEGRLVIRNSTVKDAPEDWILSDW